MTKCEDLGKVLNKKEGGQCIIKAKSNKDVDNARHRNLFLYIENTVELFEQNRTDIDVELTYEIEKMYLKGDYSKSTDRHKHLLEDIVYVAKMALECFGVYGEVVEDLVGMIDCM